MYPIRIALDNLEDSQQLLFMDYRGQPAASGSHNIGQATASTAPHREEVSTATIPPHRTKRHMRTAPGQGDIRFAWFQRESSK